MRLSKLIKSYQTDPVSGYHKLRHHVRVNQRNLLRQIDHRHGRTKLSKINARTLLKWHADWVDGTKFHAGHGFVKKLRTVFGFGLTILENKECTRIRAVLSTLRFETNKKKRKQRLLATHALAIIFEAHRREWHSIALAQAFQFELMLRQKDVIGEWVPLNEPGNSDTIHNDKKWMRGLRGDEIDSNLILKHVTSKRQKEIEANLRVSPMIVSELRRMLGSLSPGPLVVNEYTGLPYTDYEFRRKWRICATAAGVPEDVFNMDTRAGAISEAFDAQVNPDFIRQTATHSDLEQTQNYNRGDYLAHSTEVALQRAASREPNILSLPALKNSCSP